MRAQDGYAFNRTRQSSTINASSASRQSDKASKELLSCAGHSNKYDPFSAGDGRLVNAPNRPRLKGLEGEDDGNPRRSGRSTYLDIGFSDIGRLHRS